MGLWTFFGPKEDQRFRGIEISQLRTAFPFGSKHFNLLLMPGVQDGNIVSGVDGETLIRRFASLSLHPDFDADNMTDEDICPVCKNSTYLQKNLRFKINTKCYHRICEGCVDRITSTQKKCPIAGCTFAARGVIPRRGDYRVQTFEDLAIEREVDIRKRVMAM